MAMILEKQALVWQFSMISDRRLLPLKENFRQLFSYALIGILTNALGYSIYLFLTHLWGAPKITMTALYVVGVSAAFFANRRYTFRHDGGIGVTGIRYLLLQAVGYLLNLTLLLVFVDWLGVAHQITQAIAIVVVAIFLFVMSRVFVFSQSPTKSE
jgi:putative flippase GtrA